MLYPWVFLLKRLFLFESIFEIFFYKNGRLCCEKGEETFGGTLGGFLETFWAIFFKRILGKFWGPSWRIFPWIFWKKDFFGKSFGTFWTNFWERFCVKCWCDFSRSKTQNFFVSFVCFSSYQKSVFFTKSYYLELCNPSLKSFLLEKKQSLNMESLAYFMIFGLAMF